MSALNGVRVLDLTRLLPGAYATLLLADLGAEVIKIEDPRGGDRMRSLRSQPDGRNPYFELLNRNKRSVTLDLRKAEAAAVLDALIATHADVMIDSFRPSTARRLGVDRRDAALPAPAADLRDRSAGSAERPVCRARRARHQLSGAGRPAAAAGAAGAAGRRHRRGDAGDDCAIARGAGSSAREPERAAPSTCRFTKRRSPGRCFRPPPTSRSALLQRLRNRGRPVAGARRARSEVLEGFCERIERPDLIPLQHTPEPERTRVVNALRAVFRTRTRAEWLERFAGADVCLTTVYDRRRCITIRMSRRPPAGVHRTSTLRCSAPTPTPCSRQRASTRGQARVACAPPASSRRCHFIRPDAIATRRAHRARGRGIGTALRSVSDTSFDGCANRLERRRRLRAQDRRGANAAARDGVEYRIGRR